MMTTKRKRVHVLLAGLGCALAGPAFACTVSATSFQFGTIDPLFGGDTSSTSTITVSCPSLTSYTIALSTGAGTYAERYMQSGTNQLVYNLYSDASHSTIWGDGTGTSATVSGTALTEGTDHTVYGRVPHQPTAIPGTYADSIVVTVTF